MADLPFRDLAKLQEQGFYASEAARDKAIDQTLLRLYRDAYVKTTGGTPAQPSGEAGGFLIR